MGELANCFPKIAFYSTNSKSLDFRKLLVIDGVGDADFDQQWFTLYVCDHIRANVRSFLFQSNVVELILPRFPEAVFAIGELH